MQISSAPLLTDRTAATPKPAGTYGYLRDSPGDEAMKPGRQVIRGKALCSFNVFFNLFYFSLAFLSFLDFLERKSAKNFQRC